MANLVNLTDCGDEQRVTQEGRLGHPCYQATKIQENWKPRGRESEREREGGENMWELNG